MDLFHQTQHFLFCRDIYDPNSGKVDIHFHMAMTVIFIIAVDLYAPYQTVYQCVKSNEYRIHQVFLKLLRPHTDYSWNLHSPDFLILL